ncbi:MAG TPA: hypothetical protein VNG31_03090 [Candidatus Baltobacteraceae bacterium]|nr:hypothetical protein [Candidatus Baltobacteraceae bacterium]
MDERAYERVARTLNTYGVWTSWCSQFLKEAAFKLIGIEHLKHSLADAGWQGKNLTLYTDVDPGSGFGYGLALVDEDRLGVPSDKWLKVVRDHVTEHHMSYVLEGKRTHCVSGAAAPH